jgi:hypothetical protein
MVDANPKCARLPPLKGLTFESLRWVFKPEIPSAGYGFSSIQNGGHHPRHTPPQLDRMCCSLIPAEMKGQAKARETERTRPAGITLSGETQAPPIAGDAKLHVLDVRRALKGVQLQASAPQSYQRKARLRENQSLDLVHWRQVFHGVVMVVSPREQEIVVGIGFSCLLRLREGGGR